MAALSGFEGVVEAGGSSLTGANFDFEAALGVADGAIVIGELSFMRIQCKRFIQQVMGRQKRRQWEVDASVSDKDEVQVAVHIQNKST